MKLGESTSKYSLPTPLDASITNRVYEGNLKIPDRPFSELSSKEAEAIKTQRKLLHAKVLAYKNTRKDIGAKEYDGDFKADMRLLKDFIVYFSSAYTPTKSPKSIESPLERSLKNVQDFKINGEFIDADKLNESEVKNQMKVLKSEIGELKNFYGVKNGEKVKLVLFC